jgi:hypothetical protein
MERKRGQGPRVSNGSTPWAQSHQAEEGEGERGREETGTGSKGFKWFHEEVEGGRGRKEGEGMGGGGRRAGRKDGRGIEKQNLHYSEVLLFNSSHINSNECCGWKKGSFRGLESGAPEAFRGAHL